mmetsp:Transcript_98293/g.273540  ORF Transcript_98293/g.273540 Transcript_98293/m.273540 type:complete len:286 (-) Transcript_98293:40-897(-)
MSLEVLTAPHLRSQAPLRDLQVAVQVEDEAPRGLQLVPHRGAKHRVRRAEDLGLPIGRRTARRAARLRGGGGRLEARRRFGAQRGSALGIGEPPDVLFRLLALHPQLGDLGEQALVVQQNLGRGLLDDLQTPASLRVRPPLGDLLLRALEGRLELPDVLHAAPVTLLRSRRCAVVLCLFEAPLQLGLRPRRRCVGSLCSGRGRPQQAFQPRALGLVEAHLGGDPREGVLHLLGLPPHAAALLQELPGARLFVSRIGALLFEAQAPGLQLKPLQLLLVLFHLLRIL